MLRIVALGLWLTDTLARIAAGHKIGAIAELLPWAWKARQVAA